MISGNLCVHIPTYQRVRYCILCLCSRCIIETYSLPTIDCAAVNLFTTPPIYLYFLEFFPNRSHGEATRGAETAVGEAMSDQPGAAEAKQRPG